MTVKNRAEMLTAMSGKNILERYTLLVVLIALIVIASLTSNVFFTVNNFNNILRQVSMNGILACGMTFVMLTGGFDLSVGSTISLAAVVAIGTQNTLGVGGAILMALAIGAIAGMVNGVILSKINANSGDAFMITLGTQLAFAGAALLYTDARVLPGSKSAFYGWIGQGMVWNAIPTPVFIFILVAIISFFCLRFTGFGRRIYLMGGNYDAARLSGINVGFYKMIVYLIAGVTAAVSGIILSSRTMGGSPLAGVGYEMDAIAAVVVGGIASGRGSVLRTLLGVFVIGVLSNMLNLWGMSSFNQMIVKGIVVVAAVWLDQIKGKEGVA